VAVTVEFKPLRRTAVGDDPPSFALMWRVHECLGSRSAMLAVVRIFSSSPDKLGDRRARTLGRKISSAARSSVQPRGVSRAGLRSRGRRLREQGHLTVRALSCSRPQPVTTASGSPRGRRSPRGSLPAADFSEPQVQGQQHGRVGGDTIDEAVEAELADTKNGHPGSRRSRDARQTRRAEVTRGSHRGCAPHAAARADTLSRSGTRARHRCLRFFEARTGALIPTRNRGNPSQIPP